MAHSTKLHVQVCYSDKEEQVLLDLEVDEGTTIQEAILQSGVVRNNKAIDLSICKVGIYGKMKEMDTVLRSQDRVEIYRPLIADPKDARRHRVKKDRAGK